MTAKKYWTECIASAADDCGLQLTAEQLECLAESVKVSHENYGMAFYSPPPSDRVGEIEREYREKLASKEKEMQQLRSSANEALKVALKVHSDDHISFTTGGEVFLHNGRTTRIQ